LTTPDSSENGIAPETLAMIGIFHRMLNEPEFGREMCRYVLDNPECMAQFGIRNKAETNDPETVQ